jgi:hypothetical protein
VKNTGLAAEIERDLLRSNSASARHSVAACRACGRSYSNRRDSDCCSPRCAQWLADGNPPYDPQYVAKLTKVPPRDWYVIAGPPDTARGSHPFQDVIDAVTAAQHRRRQTLGFERDKERLTIFVRVADIDPKALRSPGSGDWRISGEWGSVFVNGPDGFHLSVETRMIGNGSFMEKAPEWETVKRRLHFCRHTGEGLLYLDRLPRSDKESTAIRSVLGIPEVVITKKQEAA